MRERSDDDLPDGAPELTEYERAWVRKARKADEHASWLRKRISVIWPWVLAVLAAIVAVIDWVQRHIKFS